MFQFVVTHWYPLWCNMCMWIPFWFFALGLNRWRNLSILWSQLVSQLDASKSILDYTNSWFLFMWLIHYAPTTFYNSTCQTIFTLMWEGTKGQSMITCPSQNAQTLESNLIISESTYSWSRVSIMYLVWSNYGFPWCKYDCGTSSNTFTCAFAYSNDVWLFSSISSNTSTLVFSSTSQCSTSS